MERTIPNFLIGGPPKGASTSLNFYLKQHPEIFTSPVKQTRFFSVYYDKGKDFYLQSYFNGVTNEKMVGEATPTYFLLPFVAKRIHQYNPDMKIIFCLRNPMEGAALGSSLIGGPRPGDFGSAFDRLTAASAMRTVSSPTELTRALSELLDPDRAAHLANAAWRVASDGAEVTDSVISLIRRIIDGDR